MELLFYLACAVAQYFLCKKDNKKLGFIVPAISFIASIVFSFIMPFLFTDLNGEKAAPDFIFRIIMFLSYNIPTLIYYFMKKKIGK